MHQAGFMCKWRWSACAGHEYERQMQGSNGDSDYVPNSAEVLPSDHIITTDQNFLARCI